MPSTSQCEAFLAAVDRGSITAAAASLGCSQPGVTKLIRSLEKELGFSLLYRTPHGVQPTENGKELTPLFRNIIRAQRNAEEACDEINGLVRGSLTIGSYFSVSAAVLPQVLQGFSSLYPAVRIRLREGTNKELGKWLMERSVDCCFAARPGSAVVCDWIPVLRDELCAWLPAGHPLAGRKTFPLQALERAPFIITRPNEDTDIDRLLERHHIRPDIRFSTTDAYSTYRMVEAGLGISFNQSLINARWRGGVAVLPFDPPQCVELGLSLPELSNASPVTRKFISYTRRFVKEHSSEFSAAAG
ncbi:LysR family transcriptional regulator [Mesosutterella sp. AGMB02718]|uniref:LysR family transcriptional regulator n=1 Tax=Mesosutterella faecium TaxID=2925194 RepID=A0ABT7IN26_9BURK|nr:LysR family transcriptional regulator [Mesosutterella sp. AGMB02718]MDL2059780.1 LysR family transcriptional regulator [Mesosutterella sp. AGMB02718]